MSRLLGGIAIFDAAAVRAALPYTQAIPLMREAMIALSTGRVEQRLRSFIPLAPGRTFAVMPGAVSGLGFGAKLVSVYADPGRSKTHEGLVVLFDPASGAPVALVDAGEVTALRTPAASAAATDALARPDAGVLTILGAGRQARGHVQAIAEVRPLSEVRIWSCDAGRARAMAAETQTATGLPVRACASAAEAVGGADIVCTTTAAADPVLRGAELTPGAHVNLVGSSGPNAAEVDADLLARARLFIDHRAHALAQGGEIRRALAAGTIGEDALLAEIGEVYAGAVAGRTGLEQVTVYKSLGHAVQDLAVAAYLLQEHTPC